MNDIDRLNEALRASKEFGGDVSQEHYDSIATAARAHADFLGDFPSDEDVEAAIPAFFDVPADHSSIEPIHRNRVRAALLAVADARRTEEER